MKALHALQFDGLTFGMNVDASSKAWQAFKRAVREEDCISCFGDPLRIPVVPYLKLGAIMDDAHWLVTERHNFDWVAIDGGDKIYVRYTDEPIDFRRRQK